MLKRGLSLLLAVAMMLTVLTVLPASAEQADGMENETADTIIQTDDALAETGVEIADEDVEVSPVGATEEATQPATQAVEPTEPEEPDYPVITGFENVSGGVKISWEPYGTDNTYRVYRRSGSSWQRLAEVDTTSCVVPQDAFTTSVYTIRCIGSDGRFSSWFNTEGWEYYYIGVPDIVYFANTAEGVRLYWKDSYDGLMRVYRRVVGGPWQCLDNGVAFDEELAYTDPADGSRYMYYTDTTAQNGVDYIYTIRVVNYEQNAFLTAHNGGRRYTRDGVPAINGVTNTANGAMISWDKYPGASKYRVYYHSERPGQRSWDLLGTGWKRLGETGATSFTDTTADNGELRVYTVRAIHNDAFVSDFDHVGVNNIFYAAPVFKKIEPEIRIGEGGETAGAIRLEWNALPDVQYRLYRRTSGSSWTRFAQVQADSYVDEDVVKGQLYYYTIRTVDLTGSFFLSDYVGSKGVKFTDTPAIKQIENVDGGAKITWDAVEGADYYRLYYRNESGGWSRIVTRKETSHTDNSVKDGETRVYTLRALNEEQSAFVSDFDRDGVENTYFACPVIKTIESTNEGVKLTWDKTDGAQEYRVYRKTGSGSWTRIGQTAEGAYTDATVSSGVTYRYTLRMITSDSTRFMSSFNNGRAVKYVDTPAILSLQNVDNGVKLTWSKIDGADYYRVYYKNGASWTRFNTLKQTECVDTTIKNGETRIYTVRCLDSNGSFASGFNTDGWSKTFFAPPVITGIASSGAGNIVSWKAQDGVAAYRLYRKTLNGSWGRVMDSTTASSYTDTTAKRGTIYAYTLRCMDAHGNLISSYIDKAKYYKDGKVCNGNVSEGGTFGFKDGYLLIGLNRVDGYLRYYNSEGRMYRDTVIGYDAIGYYYTDADGICCETKEMRLAAEFLAKYCKGNTLKEKAKYGFLYMANNYPYVRVYNDMPNDEKDIPPFANELFELHTGTCYRYAAAYACVMKIAGYRSRFCYGLSGALMHGWTEVYVDGYWYICDVDTQLPSYGFADYEPYMMRNHIWILSKQWYSELTVKNGKATWGRKTYF